MTKPPEKPAEPVVLSTNCIVDGKFVPAGEPVPFEREEDLPENLRPLVATGDEPPPFHHSERNIYDQQPGPEPGGAVFPATGGAQWVHRQAGLAGRGAQPTNVGRGTGASRGNARGAGRRAQQITLAWRKRKRRLIGGPPMPLTKAPRSRRKKR